MCLLIDEVAKCESLLDSSYYLLVVDKIRQTDFPYGGDPFTKLR